MLMKKLLFIFGFVFLSNFLIKAQELPDNWTGDSGIDVYQENTTVHTGSYSAKIVVNTGSQSSCDFDNSTEISVNAGDELAVYFWYFTSAHVKARIHYSWIGASGTWGGYTLAGVSDWTLFSDTVTVPTGATAVKIGIRFYDQSGFTAGEEQYVDDFTLESPLGTWKTITNGDLESWPGSSSTPTITSAYSISDNELFVIYDSPLSSINVSDYALKEGANTITFSTAVPYNGNNDSIILSDPSSTIIANTTLDTLIDAGVTDSAVFYAGIMPIEYTNAAYASPVENGYTLTVKALVTANDNYNNVWVKDGDDEYDGVLIYDSYFDSYVAVGDSILFTAERDVYNDLTELKNPNLLLVINSGNDVVATNISATDIDTSLHATLPAEKWEGQLVEIDSVTIQSSGNYYYYGTTPNGATIKIGDNVDYHFGNISMNIGTTYNIIGVVDYKNGFYRLNPRSQDDIYELAQSGSNTFDVVAGLPDNSVVAVYNNNIDTLNANFYILKQGNGVDVTFTAIDYADPTDSTVVLLLGANNTIENDNLVDTLFDAYNNISFEFYAGVLPIAMTNNTNTETIDDAHVATFTGVVTANDHYNQVWIQDAAGARNGQLLYVDSNSDTDLLNTQVGDSIYVAGIKSFYNGMTEITNPFMIPIVDTPAIAGHQVYAAQVDPSHLDYNLTQDTTIAEVWEGQLVKLNGIFIDSLETSTYQYYGHTCDGAVVAFNDDVDYHYGSGFSLDAGSVYNITGVVTFSYGHYLINPRGVDDAETVTFVGSEVQAPDTQTPGDSILISDHSDVTTAFEVARFVVADQGGDGLPTVISDMTILAGDNNTANFEDELDGGFVMTSDSNFIEFSDDAIVTPNSIQLFFAQDSMLIPDGQSREFVAYIWLNPDTAVNGHIIEFKINSDNFNVFDPTCASSPLVDAGTDIVSNQFVLYTSSPNEINKLSNNVYIYPNPATSIVNINGDVQKAELFNALVQEINIEIKDNSFDVTNLQSGVYTVRIILTNGKVINRQIIKK